MPIKSKNDQKIFLDTYWKTPLKDWQEAFASGYEDTSKLDNTRNNFLILAQAIAFKPDSVPGARNCALSAEIFLFKYSLIKELAIERTKIREKDKADGRINVITKTIKMIHAVPCSDKTVEDVKSDIVKAIGNTLDDLKEKRALEEKEEKSILEEKNALDVKMAVEERERQFKASWSDPLQKWNTKFLSGWELPEEKEISSFVETAKNLAEGKDKYSLEAQIFLLKYDRIKKLADERARIQGNDSFDKRINSITNTIIKIQSVSTSTLKSTDDEINKVIKRDLIDLDKYGLKKFGMFLLNSAFLFTVLGPLIKGVVHGKFFFNSKSRCYKNIKKMVKSEKKPDPILATPELKKLTFRAR